MLKAEDLLVNLFLTINNLNRLRHNQDDVEQGDQQTDGQSIFSRLSRSSKMSRKMTSSCSRQRLRLLIAADRISIHSFLGQARAQIKHQQGYVRRASASDISAEDAERWLHDEIAAASGMTACQFVGARQVRFLPKPAKRGYAFLCQTKAYKNELRAQQMRLLYVEKALVDLK